MDKIYNMHCKNTTAILYAFLACLISCSSPTTLDKYLNHTVVSKEKYKSDSDLVVNKLLVDLKNQEGFFNNAAYCDSTQIIVDSIIYSPDYNKRAIFLVVKNREENQLYPDGKHTWYYDGTCYLGTGVGDSLKLYWVGPSFTQSNNKSELSELIKDYCFRHYNEGDSTYVTFCRYNLNDIRFWTCSIWNELIVRDIGRKAFEEEKIKHPENVYEPKRRSLSTCK